MSKKYRVVKNPDYKKVSGTGKDSSSSKYMVPSISKFAVYYSSTLICHIPNYLENAEGWATRLANLLNEDSKYRIKGIDA
jgi:hypothetical protein